MPQDSAGTSPSTFWNSKQMEKSDTILKLRQQLIDAEEKCRIAGQYGVQLLDNVTELQNHLEEQRIEMTSAIETLEQEKYTLQREVELKQRMLESLGSEYEHFKNQQKLNQENLKEQLERNFEHETRILKDQWEKLKADLDEARLNEKQLKHKLNHQSELLANKSEELRILSEHAHETMSSEMIDLQHQIQDLETAKETLEEELNELQYKQEQLERSNSNLNSQLDRIQTEKEEREKEVVSYSRALEKVRDANQELQVQLDQALQQAQDPTSKGNSLFAEVEDRRAEMERALISVKVQHQSLQKQHAFTRQQLHRMKVQIATLLQSKGSQMDPEQLERLQAMLAQKNAEIEMLLIKIRQLEKYRNQEPETTSNGKTSERGSGDETYYVDLLKMKLENVNKEIETIKDELSLQRMKALAESQRVLELERKLFTNERHHKLCQSENMKLRISLDELKMKYEPDELTKLRTIKRKQEILPLDPPSEGIENSISMKGTCNQLSEVKDLLLKGFDQKGISQFVVETGPGELSSNLLMPKEENQIPDMLPKERKRVRIMVDDNDAEILNENNGNENPKTSVLSREQANTYEEDGITAKRQEKKTRQRAYQVIHVPSKPKAETQCPQQ